MCRVLDLSESGYYAWRDRGPSDRQLSDEALLVKVKEIFMDSYERYGSPRVHQELVAQGFRVGRKRVERLMRENGLTAKMPKAFRRTTDSDHDLAIAPNLLKRDFEVDRPNQAWVADITYLRTMEGWLFLAVVLDLFSRRVVGWALADHMRTELPLDALQMALERRILDGPGSLVHHSDRGCQYASGAYRAMLEEAGIECSMSRKGDCWDNAVAESFFGRMKVELGTTVWANEEDARKVIAEYIEVFYNCRRRHSHNGYLTPLEAEAIARQLALAA